MRLQDWLVELPTIRIEGPLQRLIASIGWGKGWQPALTMHGPNARTAALVQCSAYGALAPPMGLVDFPAALQALTRPAEDR
jgi:hypothetical protein